ncbi:hypothetical protein GUJ93_ZPchr0004g39946 [Zizania palustris]|uniref:Uncharacterized protein n=1 Tax=Zizania palustris TaxID=103762 RepID=A0A8J5VZE6_ZIZPA|nr:hypothetical protein GUJ93_ZPchr0004g39946 [Zizania palustris]
MAPPLPPTKEPPFPLTMMPPLPPSRTPLSLTPTTLSMMPTEGTSVGEDHALLAASRYVEATVELKDEQGLSHPYTTGATYRAYNNYEERMKNKPKDVGIVEWHYLMLYFGTNEFKVSCQNSENRHQQMTKHLMRSKPFSHLSYEKGD